LGKGGLGGHAGEGEQGDAKVLHAGSLALHCSRAPERGNPMFTKSVHAQGFAASPAGMQKATSTIRFLEL
jgi:hypothetical protein